MKNTNDEHTDHGTTVAHISIQMWLVLAIATSICFGTLSVYLGKDFNWDLRNYHIYNAFSFLNDRMDFDIAPAQRQSFHNPILDIPFYWLSMNLPSVFIGFLLGALQGLNFLLIFSLYWRISLVANLVKRSLIGLSIAGAACFAPGFLSELGTVFYDNTTSLLMLSAILILSHAINREGCSISSTNTKWLIVAAGLIMGISVGLKLTNWFYALSSALALLVIANDWRRKATIFAYYAIAGLVGGALVNGFWMWHLWQEFNNPFFPYYNNIFLSPEVGPYPFEDNRFLPNIITEYILWPFLFFQDGQRVAEVKFSDIRFALIYSAFIILGGKLLYGFFCARRKVENHLIAYNSGSFLLLFFVCSYLLWILKFSIYRYAVLLELLTPLVLLIILDRIISAWKWQLVIFTMMLALIAVTFKPMNWERTPWSDPYIRVSLNDLDADSGTVVMLGNSPMAYVIPFFPKSFRFIRIEGNLMLQNHDGFTKRAMQILRQPGENKFVLFHKDDTNLDLDQTSIKYGIQVFKDSCTLLTKDGFDKIVLCRVETHHSNSS